MSLRAFDTALLDYLKSHLNFDNVVNGYEDNMFDRLADTPSKSTSEDSPDIAMPLVSFWRTENSINPGDRSNFYAKSEGQSLKTVNDKEYLTSSDLTDSRLKFRSIPVDITYSIGIWSDRLDEVDEIFREMIDLFLVTDPILDVTFNRGTDEEIIQKFDIIFSGNSMNIDNTDRIAKGNLFVHKIDITVNGVFLYSKEVRKALEIPVHYIHRVSNKLNDKENSSTYIIKENSITEG